jgi:hypothetical protein
MGADSIPTFAPWLYVTYATGFTKNNLEIGRYVVAGTLIRDGKISSVSGFNTGLPHALHRGNEVTGKEKHGHD